MNDREVKYPLQAVLQAVTIRELGGTELKSDEQITSLLQRRKFDGVRHACVDRLTLSRTDVQAWLFLAYAMIGLKRGGMARLCFSRASLLDGLLETQTEVESGGREDRQILTLLEVPQVRVSVCMLIRDSARTIAKCIESLQNAVDEIVLIDTGSKDDSIKIAESYGVSVHHFEWVDDFSAARNYAQSLASHDWIIAVDSDEILFAEDKESIREVAGVFNGVKENIVLSTMQINRAQGYPTKVEPVARMFRKDSGIVWRHRIHEYPVPEDVPLSDVDSYTVRIRFSHDGYDPTKVNAKAKYERNLDLLLRDLEEHRNDIRTLFFTGREYALLGKHHESLEMLHEAQRLAEEEGNWMLPQIHEMIERVNRLAGITF